MNCLVCHEQRELVGGACAECLVELAPTIAVTPEQVAMRPIGDPTSAMLLDPWGRMHRLDAHTLVGRTLSAPGFMILDATISRHHAALIQRDGEWFIDDFGSFNGTYIEGRRIEAVTRVRDGERVRFGEVSFFFVESNTGPPDIDTSSLEATTVRGPMSGSFEPAPITVELRQPSGGGCGIAVIDGKLVKLTLPQFELVALLYKRTARFVGVDELVKTLSLDSTQPNEDHIRQLVRRLRRVLFKAGISGLIESRYGLGYRLALLRS